MQADQAKEGKGLEDPGDRVIIRASEVFAFRGAVHRGDEEEVDEPANPDETEGEEPDDASDGTAKIESM